ncbi:hypothetical protein ACE1SV_35460 [Streptomyces sennicomposti]
MGAWGVSLLLQSIRGSPDVPARGSPGVPVRGPVCVAFMIIIPLRSIPPKDTECQIAWPLWKLGRRDTPCSGRCVTAG